MKNTKKKYLDEETNACTDLSTDIASSLFTTLTQRQKNMKGNKKKLQKNKNGNFFYFKILIVNPVDENLTKGYQHEEEVKKRRTLQCPF